MTHKYSEIIKRKGTAPHLGPWWRQTLAWALLWTVTGCSAKDRLVDVEGIVTLDDQPVAGAVVTFLPIDGQGHLATGWSNADGSFRLITLNEDGVKPGDYKVFVTKEVLAAPTTPPSADPQQQIMQQMRLMSDPSKARKSLLPEIYGDHVKTPLRCTVPPPGKVVLPLKSAGS